MSHPVNLLVSLHDDRFLIPLDHVVGVAPAGDRHVEEVLLDPHLLERPRHRGSEVAPRQVILVPNRR